MSIKQNILSAIKVMKGRASKKDEEEQEDEQDRFTTVSSRNIQCIYIYIYWRYIVKIRARA